jgi:hypothetical protein
VTRRNTTVVVEGDDCLWGIPAVQARGVRHLDLIALPAPRKGVIGLQAVEPRPVPVSNRLARSGELVLLVQHHDDIAAILVRAVLGVVPLPDAGPAPQGQHTTIVGGTTTYQGRPVLVVDVPTLLEELLR